jgi:hypothetical protein
MDILYHGCAVVDQVTRSLVPEMAVLVQGGRVGWLGPAEEAPEPGPGVEVDAPMGVKRWWLAGALERVIAAG